MVTKSGEGAEDGATNSPDESMDPHDPATPHPVPAMFQVTCWLSVPPIVALKRSWPLLASEALEILNSSKITALIVTDASRPVGIVHLHDILRAGVA